MRKCRVVI